MPAIVSTLEGWTFTSPRAESTIPPEDHALLQPMFQARLVERGGEYVPELGRHAHAGPGRASTISRSWACRVGA